MNYWYLAAGVILIIVSVIVLKLLKNFILNSIFGALGFLVCYFLGIELPLFVAVIVSGIFGLSGLGVMLILKFFGML